MGEVTKYTPDDVNFTQTDQLKDQKDFEVEKENLVRQLEAYATEYENLNASLDEVEKKLADLDSSQEEQIDIAEYEKLADEYEKYVDDLDKLDAEIASLEQKLADLEAQKSEQENNKNKDDKKFDDVDGIINNSKKENRLESKSLKECAIELSQSFSKISNYITNLIGLNESLSGSSTDVADGANIIIASLHNQPNILRWSDNSGWPKDIDPVTLSKDIVDLQNEIIKQLERLGITFIDPLSTDKFDSDKCESYAQLFQWTRDKNLDGTTHSVVSPGYSYQGKVTKKALIRKYVYAENVESSKDRRHYNYKISELTRKEAQLDNYSNKLASILPEVAEWINARIKLRQDLEGPQVDISQLSDLIIYNVFITQPNVLLWSNNEGWPKEVDPVILSKEMIDLQEEIIERLHSMGITTIDPNSSEKFDSKRHEVLDQNKVWTQDASRAETIDGVMSVGLENNGEVVRKANVRKIVFHGATADESKSKDENEKVDLDEKIAPEDQEFLDNYAKPMSQKMVGVMIP